MATISFGQLANDGFSLSEGDIILIHGIKYQVCRSDMTGKYYLNNTAGNNDEVFHKLRLGDSKYALARTYESAVTNDGCFPEFNHLDNLTKFVVWLVKTPLFRVGDKVKISKRKDGETYPFGFNDGMQKHSGDVDIIVSVNDGLKNHIYNLKGTGFNWSENQFELVSGAEAVTTCQSKEHIECLEEGETVMVGSKKCVVSESGCACWITLEGELEQAIYDNLGITNEQKVALAKKYNATNLITASPEFGSLEDLTDFVNALNSGEWKSFTNPDKEEKPKKDITYEDLVGGYVLERDDTLTLAGIPYKVYLRPFLYTENGDFYGKIFDVLGIKDKDAFCERFGELASKSCQFPEFKTYEGLTKCVIELIERAEHIPVSPEPFAIPWDTVQEAPSITAASEPMPSSTTDTGIVRLPEIKDDFKIIIL